MSNDQVEQLLYRTMEGDVIRSLLSGNDTQCFTTEMYADAVDRWIATLVGKTREECGLPKPSLEISRKQLQACGLVRSVGLDVWAMREVAGNDQWPTTVLR